MCFIHVAINILSLHTQRAARTSSSCVLISCLPLREPQNFVLRCVGQDATDFLRTIPCLSGLTLFEYIFKEFPRTEFEVDKHFVTFGGRFYYGFSVAHEFAM